LPKGARDLFGIEPGDALLLLADEKQGIAILRQDVFQHFVNWAMTAPPPEQPA
jgi:AbrB family looped-hinge helix DNA binding protein